MNKIFCHLNLRPGGLNGKKHHLFSKERRLRRRNVCEGLTICFYPVHSRAESAIAFSRLHPEAAKEINQVNPVYPVRNITVHLQLISIGPAYRPSQSEALDRAFPLLLF